MQIDVKLEPIEFHDAPTTTQTVNALRDIVRFLNKTAGLIIADGQAQSGDQSIGLLMNGIIQLRGAADHFEKGPNSAGLAVPQR